MLDGWPDATAGLAATLPAADLLTLEARADSALLWALVLHRLRAGESPAERAGRHGRRPRRRRGITGRLNLLLTDGEDDRRDRGRRHPVLPRRPGQVVVASEPFDDEPGWRPSRTARC